MDFKPVSNLNVGMQHNMYDWMYTGESLGFDPTLVRNTNLNPLPDVFETFNDSSQVFSAATAFYDPTLDLIPQEYQMHPPLYSSHGLEEINFDNFLKWDTYNIPCRENIENDSIKAAAPQNSIFFQNTPNHLAIHDFGFMAPSDPHHECISFHVLQPEENGCHSAVSPGSLAEMEKKLNGRSRTSALGFDEISKYFYMTITEAAKEMKVGLTVLKKRCRELGITRWPHRKMKSLKSLIQNVQELEKSGADESVRREIATLEEHKRLMEKMPELELSDRTKKLRQACFKANYKRRRALQLPYMDPRSKVMGL